MRKRDKEQIVKVLSCVKELFSDPSRWTQGVLRKRDYNDKVVAFCLVGGINECTGYWKALDALDRVVLKTLPESPERGKAREKVGRVEAKAKVVIDALQALSPYNALQALSPYNQLTVLNDSYGGYQSVINLIDKALKEYSTT